MSHWNSGNEYRRKHGHAKAGNMSPTYSTWMNMRRRLVDPNVPTYEHYKGIYIDARWMLSFEAFLEDMGERPEGMTIDRIKSHKSYYKENCRWATKLTQSLNRRGYSKCGYKGVYYDKRVGRYTAQISINKKKHYLGSFGNPVDAHKAYLNKRKEIYGEA